MGKRDVEKQSIGQITIGIKEDSLAMETVGFIHRQLSAWRDDSDRTQEQAENKLNLQLCKFLDSRARNEFRWFALITRNTKVGIEALIFLPLQLS